VPGPQALPTKLNVNGQTVQNGSTATIVYGAAFHVSHLSTAFTLHPCDVAEFGTDGLVSPENLIQIAVPLGRNTPRGCGGV
jgi:2-keto-4-pentenoate hydratase/2-oxohepta-3-ene-1,7-dioic acid hydratase in catechol pathway